MSEPRLLSTVAARLIAATPLCLAVCALQAQTAAATAPGPSSASSTSSTPGTAAAAPIATAAPAATADAPAASTTETRLPGLSDLGVAVPRPVRAASAMLGMGRQRLALVLGVGTLGSRTVLDNAARDTQAVAQALRDGGFVVMQREDLTAADLRAALKEFQNRLQPGGIGFVYAAALGAQVDGQNLLLPRDVQLDASLPLATRLDTLRQQAVPLGEVVDALMGPAGSPRLLVVDAAWRHPALTDLPAAGLGAQRLPPGVIALFSAAPGTAREVPVVPALPALQPAAPLKPEQIAATPFARTLVGQLTTARAKAPDALRATRRALVDGSLGLTEPWIGGDTEGEELAEATLLDGLVPRSPGDLAREAARQLARASTRAPAGAVGNAGAAQAAVGNAAGAAGNTLASTASNTVSSSASSMGEQSVNEVLEEARRNRPVNSRAAGEASAQNAGGDTMRPTSARGAPAESGGSAQPSADSVRPSMAQAPGTGQVLSQAAGAAGSAARAAASVATTAAGAAAVVKAAEAAATVSVAGAAIGAAGSLAGQAVALATRGGGGASAVEAPVAAAAAATTAMTAASPSAGAGAGAATAARALAASTAPPAAPLATAPISSAPLATVAPAGVATPVAAGTGPLASTAPAARVAQSVEQVLAEARLPAARVAPPSDGRTVRTANGGERPAYVPRSNAFGYAEGDTYTYQIIDTWKDEVTGQSTTAIEEVLDDGRLLANGQQVQLDAQGRLLWQAHGDGTVSMFEPRQELWWSNPKRGEDRDLRFTETLRRATPRLAAAGRRASGEAGGSALSEIEWKGSASVGRLRKVELPAGEFEVLPIESSGWQYARRSDGTRVDSKWSRTVWYSPKLGHPVAIDIEDTDHLGRLLRRERVELVHAQAARQAP